MAYPYENFILDNFQEPLSLTKEDFWSTLKQEIPPDEKTKRTQKIIEKVIIKNGQELTMLYSKMDNLQLTDVFENFVEKSTLIRGINQLSSYSASGYTWKAGLKMTKIELDFIKDKH